MSKFFNLHTFRAVVGIYGYQNSLVAYLKFRLHWEFCILSGNPSTRAKVKLRRTKKATPHSAPPPRLQLSPLLLGGGSSGPGPSPCQTPPGQVFSKHKAFVDQAFDPHWLLTKV